MRMLLLWGQGFVVVVGWPQQPRDIIALAQRGEVLCAAMCCDVDWNGEGLFLHKYKNPKDGTTLHPPLPLLFPFNSLPPPSPLAFHINLLFPY